MNLETLFLQIFNEAKDRFIKELALTDEEKDKYITLFKTHPELEKEIDWNDKKSITKETLESVYQKSLNSESAKKRAKKQDKKLLFTDKPSDFKILEETDTWIFVYVKSYEGAKFCDSFNCGGNGAKWCIGDSKSDTQWIYHTGDRNEDFVLAFNKDTNEKWMLCYGERIYVCNQENESFFDLKTLSQFGIDLKTLQTKFPDSSVDFNFKAGTKIITKEMINGQARSAIIPSSVIKLEKSAFFNCKKLETIALPNSILNIEDNVFYNCFNLKAITLSQNLTSIGSYVFAGCLKLENLIIPPSVQFIGDFAFSCCDSLILKIPKKFESYNLAFDDCKDVVFY